MKWQKIKEQFKKPRTHLIFLVILLVIVYSQSTIVLMDDAYLYLRFTEKLATQGVIDLSIGGFHGGDFLAVPVYWLSNSDKSVAYLNILAALANIFMIYFTVKTVFKNKLYGVLAAYIYLLNPFEYLNPLRGHHHTIMIFMVLFGVFLMFKDSKYTFIPFGISYIIRPFGVALAPLFFYKRQFKQFFLSLAFPAVYVLAQLWQTSQIAVGVHGSLGESGMINVKRAIMNLGYAFQNYFSIHNYSPLNCLEVADMIHFTPFLSFFALLGIFYYKKYFKDQYFFFALLVSAVFAIGLPTVLHHLDMWYLWTFNFTLVLLALPALSKHERLWPVVVASFLYQFYYTFLAYNNVYWHNKIVFIVPMSIFLISIYYVWHERKRIF